MKKLDKSGIYDVYKPPTPDWGLVCGLILAMLGLVGMLVFLLNR